MVAPPRVSAALNSFSPDSERVIICMVVVAGRPLSCRLTKHGSQVELWASDCTSFRACLQFKEWKLSENSKCRQKSDWRLEPKHHLPLSLDHLVCSCPTLISLCVCASALLLKIISHSPIDWKANRNVALQVKAGFCGWVHPWECDLPTSSRCLPSPLHFLLTVANAWLYRCSSSSCVSADGGEVGLLSFVSRPRAPAVLRGHGGGAAQRFAAEEDRTVHPRKGKTPDLDVFFFYSAE